MSDIKKQLVLVFFFEEKKFSILKLKDAVSSSCLENIDITNWDPTRTIETKWNDCLYPANFLQFGENKNDMEKLIDSLVDGSTTVDKVPILQSCQKECMNSKRIRLNQQEAAVSDLNQQQPKRQKLAAVALKKNMKQQSILKSVKRTVDESACSQCCSLSKEVVQSKKRIVELEEEVQAKIEKAEIYKQKYKEMKKKYKANKESQMVQDRDFVRIGDHLSLEKSRLANCRVTHYSKYVCDMMDVVFGRDALAHSVLRGIKGSSKSALDPNIISDIQGHVATRFNVDVALVRATMRNKLNTASKAEIAANKLK